MNKILDIFILFFRDDISSTIECQFEEKYKSILPPKVSYNYLCKGFAKIKDKLSYITYHSASNNRFGLFNFLFYLS